MFCRELVVRLRILRLVPIGFRGKAKKTLAANQNKHVRQGFPLSIVKSWDWGRKGTIAITANSKRSFGEILHYARKSRGMTIKQLESRSGVSASFISRIENDNGNPSVEIVGKLAEALGIPVSDFFYDQKGGKILYPLRLAQARLLQDQDVGELMELLVSLSSDQRRAVVQIAAGAIQLLKSPGGRALPVDSDDPA